MHLLELLDVAVLWRVISALALMWLAVLFGRTLCFGDIPLIERFARASNPVMTPEFRIYTRRLTGIWCGYFILAALTSWTVHDAPIAKGVLIWSGSIGLFVGEHRLRPRFFPAQKFPGLLQQLRDTWHVWHST